MATAMMAMMMPAISNRTSDTNTNIKNSLFFSLSPLSHQPEYLHPYLVKSSSSSLSLCYPSRFSNSAFLYQIFNSDLTIAAYSYSPLSLKPLSLSSPPPPETTPKATLSDLLSARPQPVFSKEQHHNRHQEEPILDQGRNDPNAARRRHSRGHRCRPSQARRGRWSLCYFRASFFCGCRNLGEALRRVREGAAMGEEGRRSRAVQMGNRKTKYRMPWICCTVNQA